MIIGSAWGTQLFGVLQSKGMQGSKLMDFSNAVGIGSAGHIVGKPFSTVDTGLTIGVGAGVGVGIFGVAGATVASAIYAASVAAFGQAGSKLMDVCDAIGEVLESQLALASLSSVHAPVFAGAGVITPGSIAVVAGDWGSQIEAEGTGAGFEGVSWPDFASAIGTGQAQNVLASGTGNVAITGVWSGLPPVPVGGTPGVGTGSGTVA